MAGIQVEYSKLDQKRVVVVRSLQKRIGFPNDNDLANTIDYNVIDNCQFNQQDICIANKIRGKSIAELKGKSTKRKAKMARGDMKCEVQKAIMDAYGEIHLDINIMYMNKVTYFTVISQNIRCIHCMSIKGQVKHQVLDALKKIIKLYKKRGFLVKSMFGDNEFRPLEDWLTKKKIDIKKCDAKAHVPMIERTNRFLKERIKCIRCNMSFKKLPKRFLIKVVLRTTILVSSLPRKGCAHPALSPREIVTGKKFCVLQAYTAPETSNDTEQERTMDDSYLGPSENESGHNVFKLLKKRYQQQE